METPTGLKLAKEYSRDIHRRLVLDGVLADGDCADPDDLSLLASAVWDRHGTQVPVVERFPLAEFRLARPNAGYLEAAALLREGAVASILTLNFDVALTAALSDLSATEIDIVSGPGASTLLGSSAVVYLHRNVEETDLERWILRLEALDEEWRDDWEECVARRVMTCPVVAFAGLGSPAAVLTETIARIRQALPDDQHQVYVVDPASSTPFQAVLGLPPAAHVRTGWCSFMHILAQRVLEELIVALRAAARDLRTANIWADSDADIDSLCDRFKVLGLVDAGRVRAKWLLDEQSYAPDDSRRILIADLILSLGVAERSGSSVARFHADGLVSFEQSGKVGAVVLPVSGGGAMRWAALEPRMLHVVDALPQGRKPTHVLVGGLQGNIERDLAPPQDLVLGDESEDIVQPSLLPDVVTIEELRDAPDVAAGW